MSSSASNAPRALLAGRVLAFAGIVLVAFSMRAAVAALSPLIPHISQSYELTTAAIALLGSIAPLSFAFGGIVTPRIEKRIGLERTLIVALVFMALGHVIRALSVNWQTLAAGTLLALVGMGFANVAMPPAVRKYFPDRVSTMTAIYMSVMSVSAFLPALVAVPVADAIGWRGSLLEWAVFAVIALVPWILEFRKHRQDTTFDAPEESVLVRKIHPWRSPTAWSVGIVLAVSSVTGYAMYAWMPVILIDIAGVSAAQAGALLALFAGIGLPLAFATPGLAKKMGKHVHWLVTISSLFYLVGYLGLLYTPEHLTWLWVAVLGTGCLEFPLSLTLVNLRTANMKSSMALSGFAQIVAYVSAAMAPPLMGLLYGTTADWTVVLTTLMVISIAANIPAAVILRRNRTVDAELAAAT
ncbi:CynX/NimT family MFS transporter [Aurantimicrobium sp. MWH-Uga1]|uniref:MFS transporter n=1 Tax=Aurantimicrobium sp. MWH-Uga1 TaxID=2079575 RepID=UPI000DED9A76|nr:MFS transporter [Aurantimicrobium sp. MWH-Uga1]AXE54141.1 Inner membrane transport protein YeaN [Aurantimicrobium sp. MWH-Uga1]